MPAMKLIADDETCNMFHGVAMISPWPHKPFRHVTSMSLLYLMNLCMCINGMNAITVSNLPIYLC